VRMPMTAIAEFGRRAGQTQEPLRSVLAELDRICRVHDGLWCTEAEDFLLSRKEIRLEM